LPAGVSATYAIVPKSRLAEALAGPREALAIEADWREEARGVPNFYLRGGSDFSIVAFVGNASGTEVRGLIGVLAAGPVHPRLLYVDLEPGCLGTYAIDSAGSPIWRIFSWPKRTEWIRERSGLAEDYQNYGPFFASVAMGEAMALEDGPRVTVIYAVVPRERLADAIAGERQALAIEGEWRERLAAYPEASVSRTSIVVFVANTPNVATWGELGLPVRRSGPPVIVEVSLAPGYRGTYVVDDGGRPFPAPPADHKPFAWVKYHSE
jgi:hypothetical protein